MLEHCIISVPTAVPVKQIKYINTYIRYEVIKIDSHLLSVISSFHVNVDLVLTGETFSSSRLYRIKITVNLV